MSQYDLLFDKHIISGLYPKADAFDTAMTTDFVSLSNYRKLTFLIHTGVATGGTANGTVTLLASAVAAGSSTTALAFKYRVCASSTTVDTWGALTDATSSGFSMTVGSNLLYEVEVLAEEVEVQAAGKYFVGLKVTEVTNDPVVAGVIAILSDARYPQAVPVQAIA
jgi:hypothetical protein